MDIRTCAPGDLAASSEIALRTGHLGSDASPLYADAGRGHIDAAPYALLAPDLALVVEDDGRVGGFAVGTGDTRAWEERLEGEWWPSLRARCPDSAAPDRQAWSADRRRASTIHHPPRSPARCATGTRRTSTWT